MLGMVLCLKMLFKLSQHNNTNLINQFLYIKKHQKNALSNNNNNNNNSMNSNLNSFTAKSQNFQSIR